MIKYILPVTTGTLLLIFYLALPNLSHLQKVNSTCENRISHHFTGKDIFILLIVTLLAAVLDFAHLGNKESVQTFMHISSSDAILTLEEETEINQYTVFTGIGYGDLIFETSADGIDFTESCRYTLDAGGVLKWQNLYPYEPVTAKAVRITATGNAWLGEVCLLCGNEEPVPFQCSTPELCDEQTMLTTHQSFMNSTYFDEIYHARTAWEHLNNINPYEVSHPPLGKLIISLGIRLFGMTPFGWRFTGTLAGVLMIPLIYLFLKILFGSTFVATCGSLIMASEFMHYVQTRIATIDSYAVLFIILMYLFMYLYISEENLPALALSGIFFGIGSASKWTCIYAGAGLAVIWLAHQILRKDRSVKNFLKNALFCLVFFVLIPCCIYYISYYPYGKAAGKTNLLSRDYLDIVLANQKYMFEYHSKLVAEHPYSSIWIQWMLDIRPILYYLEYFNDGTRSSFGAFLNPVLCWGGLLALFALLYRAIFRRDTTAAFILIGYLAQLIPWVFITRLTFEYHYFPCSVFLLLAIGYIFHIMEENCTFGRAYMTGLTVLSVILFILFYPALSGMKVDNRTASALLQWLPTWPF